MRTITGAHSGTGSWLLQRATALLLAVLLPVLGVHTLAALPLDYAGWLALFSPVWVKMAWMLAALAQALHAWVGLRDVLMDYVKPVALRLALYLCVQSVLAASVVGLGVSLGRIA